MTRRQEGVPQGRAPAAGRFTLAPLVWEALQRYADRRALIDEGGTPLSYAALASAIARRADALRALGARRIAVMAPTESAMTVWWLTAMGMTGVAVTVVSPARAADERAAAVDAFGPDVIVTHADADLDGATPAATIASPWPSIGEHGSEMLARTSRAPRPPSDVTEHLRHIVVTTSGTTGSPKVVVHSDRSLGRALWVTTMLRRETLGGESAPTPRQLTAGELGKVVFDGGPHDLVYLNGMPVATISGMTVLLQSILTGWSRRRRPTTAPHHDDNPDRHARTIVVNGTPCSYFEQLAWTSLAGVADLPAVVVPAGLAADGLPVGLQVMAASHDDLNALRFAAWMLESGLLVDARPPL